MNNALLTIHVLSAAAWIGTSMFFSFAGPRFAKQGGPPAVAWIGVVIEAIRKFLVPAAILTALTGILIVVTNDAWEWSDGFVSIGLVVFVVAVGIGTGYNLPNLKKALGLADEGKFPEAGATAKRVGKVGMVVTLLLVLAELAMVYRFGS